MLCDHVETDRRPSCSRNKFSCVSCYIRVGSLSSELNQVSVLTLRPLCGQMMCSVMKS